MTPDAPGKWHTLSAAVKLKTREKKVGKGKAPGIRESKGRENTGSRGKRRRLEREKKTRLYVNSPRGRRGGGGLKGKKGVSVDLTGKKKARKKKGKASQ